MLINTKALRGNDFVFLWIATGEPCWRWYSANESPKRINFTNWIGRQWSLEIKLSWILILIQLHDGDIYLSRRFPLQLFKESRGGVYQYSINRMELQAIIIFYLILSYDFYFIKCVYITGGPKVILHLNRYLRREAPSRWGSGIMKCTSGQWEFSAMASFSGR